MKFKDKTAIIAGGGSGIGRATALEAAREGANVVIADINMKMANETGALINTIEGSYQVVEADLSKDSEAKKVGQLAVEAYGAIHYICYSV